MNLKPEDLNWISVRCVGDDNHLCDSSLDYVNYLGRGFLWEFKFSVGSHYFGFHELFNWFIFFVCLLLHFFPFLEWLQCSQGPSGNYPVAIHQNYLSFALLYSTSHMHIEAQIWHTEDLHNEQTKMQGWYTWKCVFFQFGISIMHYSPLEAPLW